jgi:H+/gluconate symporter-like permease
MDMTGSARSLANKLVSLIGSRFALLAVIIPCLLMTYGGISLFVVVFVIYPMGYAIYREADLPRTLLPGAIAFGAFGITMTAIPGTPQIQNIIPTTYYGTTAAAAPFMGIVAAVCIAIPGYVYLDWRIRRARKQGLHFEEDAKHTEQTVDTASLPSWHWVSGLLPLIVVVLMLNVLPGVLSRAGIAEWSASESIVVALVGGIAVTCLLNLKQFKTLLPAISAGANGSLTAIMNTACAVGFGSVVKAVPGFALLKTAMLNMPGSVLFSEAVAVNVEHDHTLLARLDDATIGIVKRKPHLAILCFDVPIGEAIALLDLHNFLDHGSVVTAVELLLKKRPSLSHKIVQSTNDTNLLLVLVHDRNKFPQKIERELSAQKGAFVLFIVLDV